MLQLQIVNPLEYDEVIEDVYLILVGNGYPVNPTSPYVIPHISELIIKSEAEIKDLIFAEETRLAVERGDHDAQEVDKPTFQQLVYERKLLGFSSPEKVKQDTVIYVKEFLHQKVFSFTDWDDSIFNSPVLEVW